MALEFDQKLTEIIRFDWLLPVQRSAAAYNTSWLSMRDAARALVVLKVGALAAGATVDLKLQRSDDDTGTDVQDIAGKAITQLTQAGGDTNKVVTIELTDEQLEYKPGLGAGYFRAVLTISTDTAFTDLTILRSVPKYAPVDSSNLEEVV